jgi:hypothetical protein
MDKVVYVMAIMSPFIAIGYLCWLVVLNLLFIPPTLICRKIYKWDDAKTKKVIKTGEITFLVSFPCLVISIILYQLIDNILDNRRWAANSAATKAAELEAAKNKNI